MTGRPREGSEGDPGTKGHWRGPGTHRGPRETGLMDCFRRELESLADLGEGAPVVVAVSGGLDSLVLLHLLRFGPGMPRIGIHAAHFDHRMRPGSGMDAAWVRGLCKAWEVPCREGAASRPPVNEEEARDKRYAFLFRVRDEVGARWLFTAHHADDQAETVLFRILRGTGLKGLGGIPRSRRPGIFRPLLPFSRSTLEAYAGEAGIRFREDPSNRDLSLARNYLRRVGLPGLEENVTPGAKGNLLRLARLARENEKAWDALIPGLVDELASSEERGVFVVRSGFLAYHPSVGARLVRELLRRKGIRLSEAGTRRVLEFTRTGASGRSIPLPGGFRLAREFDRFLLALEGGREGAGELAIPGPGEGSGQLTLGGSRYEVRWGGTEARGMAQAVHLSRADLAFPLSLRGWSHGDRIALPYGTKKLKKLLYEAGIGVGERSCVPVLVDASGRVLWVVGVAVSAIVGPEKAEESFIIGIGDVTQR